MVILAGATTFAKKKGENGSAKIKFTEQVHDFGAVKEDGGPVKCDFQFVNVGDGNLVVVDATAECGCTRPEFPKNPIAPGKRGKIHVTFNPIGRVGSFEKVVIVKTNGNPRKTRLKIRGSVIPKK